MAKSSLEKAIEKQRKEAEKSARQAQLRERANAIVSGTEIVSGFRVMDREAENMLSAILEQYDGNENNHVNFVLDNLPRYLQDSFLLQCEKLQMYGMLSSAIVHMGGVIFTLSESGKQYLEDKEKAYNRLQEQTKKQEDIEVSNHKKYDVFISHASSDKSEYVDLLNMAIRRLGINVFYDTDVLSWGDNWKKVILDGTADSEFAIIVISKNFFGREWTERELEEFLKQQNESGQKKVLPLLYEITLDDLKEHYPDLEEIQCISAEKYTKEEIVILLAKELIKRYK